MFRMDAFCQPVVDTLVNILVNSISTRLNYIRNYRSNFEELETELVNLRGKRSEIENSVQEAENKGEEIEQHVKEWLVKVDKMVKDVTEFVTENEKAEMKCLKNLCPDLKKRYCLGKKAVEKAKNVSTLREQQLAAISHRPILQGTSHLSTEFINCESRITTLNDVINALESENVVGIYGMGGVGKTTLAKRVGQTPKGKQLFDFLVFVEVKEQPNVEEIQNTISGMLNLELDGKVLSVRAEQLYAGLEKKKKVLIILDNIWKEIDLREIGIPLADGDKGCHLLLTSRYINVLRQMGSRKEFPIEALGKEDSWKLFAETAGSCIQQDDIESIARDVADRCGGLSIAIVTVAKALKEKPVNVWEAALQEFQQYSDSSVIEKGHSCIQLSYKHLNPNGLKPIFLLCCILSTISRPSIENLLRYGLILNIFDLAKRMEDQRSNVSKVIQELVNCSLLLELSDDGIFSIHDVVCEVGTRTRTIAPAEEFLIVDEILRPSIQRSLLQNLTWLFFMDMAKFPNKLNCPKLTFLYLKTKSRVPMPNDFFSGMSQLEVIHLEGLDLMELPKSLCSPVELGALFLKGCKLGDISIIGELKNLEILVVSESQSENMMILSESIGNLSWLRLLDLRGSPFIIPPNIISRLTLLEELYMNEWKKLDIKSSVASLQELLDLQHLSALQVGVADADAAVFSKSAVFQNLKRYNICIGSSRYYRLRDTSRTLHIDSSTEICVEGVIKQLKGIENLCLRGKCIIKNNSLCELVDKGFPSLKILCLMDLVNLEKICDHHVRPQRFCQLTRIEISECHRLKNLFPLSIINQLLVLKVIRVTLCENISEIFTVDRAENGAIDPISFKKLDGLFLTDLPKLTRICSEMEVKIEFSNLRILQLMYLNLERILPSLVQNLREFMTIYGCHKLEYIFSSSTHCSAKNLRDLSIKNCDGLQVLVRMDDDSDSDCGCIEFLSLESLVIETCPSLRELIGKMEETMEGVVLEGTVQPFSFRNLKILEVYDCSKMMSVISVSTAQSLVVLEKMSITCCKNVIHIIENQEDVVGGEITWSKLKILEFGNLDNATNFYSGNCIFNFPLLEKIKAYRCPNIMFFSSGAFTMPKLQQVEKNWTSHNCKDHELNALIAENMNVKKDGAGTSTLPSPSPEACAGLPV